MTLKAHRGSTAFSPKTVGVAACKGPEATRTVREGSLHPERHDATFRIQARLEEELWFSEMTTSSDRVCVISAVEKVEVEDLECSTKWMLIACIFGTSKAKSLFPGFDLPSTST